MRFLVLFIVLFSTFKAQAQLATPAEAIDLALAAPLEYVGQYASPGSESGTMKSCVFRNKEVTLVYDYCHQEEVPAVSMRIFVASTHSSVEIYAEGAGNPSQIFRSSYFDQMWRIRAAYNLPSFQADMTIDEIRDYEVATQSQIGCSVFFMESLGLFENCFEGSQMNEEMTHEWVFKASAFWHEPSEAWYALQKLLRTQIQSTL